MLTRSGTDVRPVRSVMAELDALVRAECEALRGRSADDPLSAHERRRIERTVRWLRSRPNAEWLFEEIRARTWPGERREPAPTPVAPTPAADPAEPPAMATVAPSAQEPAAEPPPDSQQAP